MATFHHFKGLFTAKDLLTQAQLDFINHVPLLIQETENDILGRPVTIEEIHNILLACVRDKILGPYPWGMELYIHFFQYMSSDLLAVAKESKVKGYISGSINNTFISLIPRNKSPIYFKYFRPISLCNSLYKMISKIIAYRLNIFFSACISPKKFGFFGG